MTRPSYEWLSVSNFISVQYVHCTTVNCNFSHWLTDLYYHGAECPNCGGVMEYEATYTLDTKNKRAHRVLRANKNVP